ncbi:hypothetical protein C9975_04300 [Thalassospira xiamenensis]|nr:hypothetical protein C9975_04300 [Thalassospira xiamenensis]
MSLSVFYRGTKVKFGMRFSRRRLLSLVGVGVLVTLAYTQPWQYQGVEPKYAQQRISEKQKEIAMQARAVAELKQETEKKLTAMTLYLGEMRAQMRRLDALGQRLAQVAEVDNGEFSFVEDMPIGGPELLVTEMPVSDGHEVMSQIDDMLVRLSDKQKQLSILESVMMNHNISDESFIAGRPITSGWMSSQYGIRKDPFNGSPTMHKGLDFASYDEDVQVISTGAGVVTWAGSRYGYGQLVEIDHGAGLSTRYGHNDEILVKVGDVVTRGQEIAKMGSTGRSTGPHVHYEVLRNGRQIDPYKFVYRKVEDAR